MTKDLIHEWYINKPRGTDVSRVSDTTVIATESEANKITVSTDKAGYLYGVNFNTRANVTAVKLYIDNSTTASKEYLPKYPPESVLSFGKVVNIDPPLRFTTNVILKATGSTTLTGFRSVLCAYEDDQ